MTRKFLVLIPAVLVLLLVVVVAAAAQQRPVQPQTNRQDASQENRAVDYTYNTVITVTSGTDPDTSMSYTCYTGPVAPDGKCTLRRAIVESRNLSGGQLPVLISFNIPEDPGEGYDSSLGIWKIEPQAPSDLMVYRYIKGEVIIDGDTQPGGRATGPKIILTGPQTAKDGLKVGETAGDDNVIIRGLAFQNFKTHIYVNTDNNLIEDCWFGLSDDGTTLTSGDDTDPEGGSAVSLQSSADGNVIRNNFFAGFTGVAAAIRGTNNVFSGNWVGANASGLVPLPAQFDQHPCIYGTWNGGTGITVDDDDNQIGGPTAAEGNHFVGLYLESFVITNQKHAMEIGGQGHVVQNNVIGLDINGDEIGVCGRGLSLLDGPADMDILDNTIVEPGYSAIMASHWTFNGNTIQGNIIKRESPWPGALPGQDNDEGAIVFCTYAPPELLSFTPAEVTQVNGKTVKGTYGEGSPCPNCIVELFLDDSDSIVEALQSVAMVTADGSGKWTATLPAPLEPGQGLRTMSTVPDNFTISGLHEGTTSGLSELQAATYLIFLPILNLR